MVRKQSLSGVETKKNNIAVLRVVTKIDFSVCQLLPNINPLFPPLVPKFHLTPPIFYDQSKFSPEYLKNKIC